MDSPVAIARRPAAVVDAPARAPTPACSSPVWPRRWPVHYGVIIVVVAVLGSACSMGLARFGYSMVLIPMRQGLGLSDSQAGLLGSADLAGYLLASLVAGALTTRFGLRVLAAGGLAWAGAAMALTGLAPDFGAVLGLRVLTGLGTAAATVGVTGVVGPWSAPRRRGRVAGLIVGGTGLGLLLAGVLVPSFVQAFGAEGWRPSWTAFGGVALVVALLAWVVVRDAPAEVGLLPLGGSATPPTSQRPTAASWSLVYRSPALWRLGTLAGLWGFAYILYTTFFGRYVTAELAYTPAAAGALWSVVGVCSIVSGLLWGLVADRIGGTRALAAMWGVQGAAIAVLVAAPAAGVLAPISALLFGLTAWATPSLMAVLASDYCGPRLTAAGFGFICFFFGLGQTASPALGGGLAEAVGSFGPTFSVAAALLLVCALAALRLPVQPVELGTTTDRKLTSLRADG
jgi:predicted MFS family arabinose efflux permease